MPHAAQKRIDEEDPAPKISKVKVDCSKLGSVPNLLRSHSFGNCISEGIIAKALRDHGGQKEDKIEKGGRMIDK